MQLNRVEHFAHKAFAIAEKGDHAFYRLGAIIMKGGKILGTGYNTPLRHAEVNAIRNSSKTKGATLIVVRITPTGFAMSKPCSECMKAIKKAGIKTVHYSTREGFMSFRVNRYKDKCVP